MDVLEGLETMEAMEAMRDVELQSMLPGSQLEGTLELAPPMELQAEEIGEAFREIPELQHDEWVELDEQGRLAALAELAQRVAEIAMRPPMEVQAVEFEKPTTLGQFDGERLMISTSLLMDDSYESYKETLNTLLHEGRHAYQSYNLDVQQVEPNSELVNSWRANLEILGYDNGERPYPDYLDLGYWEYYTQPVEVDARVYAATGLEAMGL